LHFYKKNRKLFSLITIFILLVYVILTNFILLKVKAGTIVNASDTLTRIQISQTSSHTYTFTMSTGVSLAATESVSFDFNEDGSGFVVGGAASVANDFDFTTVKSSTTTEAVIYNVVVGSPSCAGSTGANDVAVGINDSTGVVTIEACGSFTTTDTASVLSLEYGTAANDGGAGTNRVTNPSSAASYEIIIGGNFGDTGETEIPIIDDDTVNVSGFIDTFISFDIDTTNVTSGAGSDCAYNTCLDYAGGPTNTTSYTVDLGGLTIAAVNQSGTSVVHSDGGTGAINSIYFDLSSNADSGVVVTVDSLNGFLQGPAANTIPSVTNGSNIVAGTEAYGLQLLAANTSAVGGTITSSEYCSLTTSPVSIFTSNGDPVDTGRIDLDVAATPNSLDAVGTYTDELTFVATATF